MKNIIQIIFVFGIAASSFVFALQGRITEAMLGLIVIALSEISSKLDNK